MRGQETRAQRGEPIAVPLTGQCFAFDRSQPGILYGIDRPKRQVVVVRLGDRTE